MWRILAFLVLAGFLASPPLSAAGAQEQELAPVDVVLDPGHSWADVGAAGPGVGEYEITLDLAQRTRAYLEAAGLTVRLTREDHAPLTDLTTPWETDSIQREQTARIAAGGPTRAYVSLHLNGGPTALHGTETYFNPDRGISADEDFALAAALQRNVLGSLGEYGYASFNRGVKNDLLAGKPYGHFFSLRGAAPSALVESLFLSNPTEAALVSDEAGRDAIARGCAQGILEYLAGAG